MEESDDSGRDAEELGAELPDVTPYRPGESRRVARTRADLVEALRSHVTLLRNYAQRAFGQGDSDYFSEVAAKLRLLVYEHGRNRPLLLGLMGEFGIEVPIVLGGPPVQRPPSEPGPGDEISLREYLAMNAAYVNIPPRGLVSFTKSQIIAMWAQQVGGAHEDWEIEEELAHTLYLGININGLPIAAHELRVTTETVLYVADTFLREIGDGPH